MSSCELPKLRPYLAAAPADASGRVFILYDRLRLSRHEVRVSPDELEWIQLFDGQRSLRDVQCEVMRLEGGRLVPLEYFSRLADQLDTALFLDSPRYRDRAMAPIRPATHTESYGDSPEVINHRLHQLFTHPRGAGLPGEPPAEGRLRAVLAPHIDYGRGGLSYTFAFKELYEQTTASLFVIIGTSHYSRHRFTLTRKHFETPLGIAQTDQAYIDRLVNHHGDGLFDDELWAHHPEHSIELEVVFLQYLYAGKRDIRIVPLVVGSFQDCMLSRQSPQDRQDIRRMVEALAAAERETNEPICYVISGDLAHIGPEFGDRGLLSEAQLYYSRQKDQALLARTERVDEAGYYNLINEEGDGRRICGLPPTWLTLAATKPSSGRVLHYDQYVHPRGQLSVSFASVGFYR